MVYCVPMAELELEDALQRKCNDNKQYATLWSQWNFDKKLISRALESVALTFPHYSRHNASHSDTILQQVARILGPRRIEKLGATDLWLILESAYNHDIGMIVPEPTMREWWAKPEFRAFLEQLTQHDDSEIAKSAKLLINPDVDLKASKDWPFLVRRALVLVIAEYARPGHPGRSRQIVESPSLVSFNSPRTQLVPNRFWRLLGRICESHGGGFADAMRLPREESGFAMDTAHPRFVACMLRLGDLLDLDDGRFCPVMIHTFGGLPPLSLAHEEKHHSIEEFLVNQQEIRVIAECETPRAYDETVEWLSWLRQELQNQSLNWAQISPEVDFSSVPSASIIEAKLKGYDTFPDGQRPRFGVDKEAMLNMVRSVGLYKSHLDGIRELLQNAVDATLLRAWNENQNQWRALAEQPDKDLLDKLRSELEKYPISVKIKKVDTSSQEIKWQVEVEDNGIGINKEDVVFLQRVGASKKNPRRHARMENMPVWMRPSGTFGIGLQSVFLFSNKVVLLSRADDSLDTIELTFEQGVRRGEPEILLKTLPRAKGLLSSGTRVSFVISTEKVPVEIPYIAGQAEETKRILYSYDPLLDDEMLILPSEVYDTVREFADTALAKFELITDNMSLSRAITPKDQQTEEQRYFDAINGIEFTFSDEKHSGAGLKFYYRGRRTDWTVDFGLGGRVDWHRDDAAEILTLDRSNVRLESKEEIRERIRSSLQTVLPLYYQSLKHKNEQETIARLALVAKTDAFFEGKNPLPEDDASWKTLPFYGTSLTLGKLTEAENIFVKEDVTLKPFFKRSQVALPCKLSNNSQQINIKINSLSNLPLGILDDRSVQLVTASPQDNGWQKYVVYEWNFSKAPLSDIVSEMGIFEILLDEIVGFTSGLARFTIPCPKQFESLRINPKGLQGKWFQLNYFPILQQRCIFPFRREQGQRFTLAGALQLIKYTFQYRCNQTTTELDIARSLLSLVELIDKRYRAKWGSRADYSIESLRYDLRNAYGADL